MGWTRRGIPVVSTCATLRGSRFSSQPPHGSPPLPVTSAPGNPTPSPDLQGLCTRMVPIQTCKATLIHQVSKSKIFKVMEEHLHMSSAEVTSLRPRMGPWDPVRGWKQPEHLTAIGAAAHHLFKHCQTEISCVGKKTKCN